MGGTAFAEQTVASGIVVSFIAIMPLFLVVINLAFGVRPARGELIAVSIGVIGVLMLTQGAGFHASPTGLVAIALATTAWSVGSVLSQRGCVLAPGPTGFASELLCGGTALLVMSAQTEAWLAWVYLTTFGSLVAFSAYMVLLARTSTSVAASYALVNPVVALILGVSLGHEMVSAWEWLSAAVVMLGVVLLFVTRRR
jgi:drug/metabolite transporter (DMT)-like permease